MRKGDMIKDFRKKVLEKKKDITDQEILLSDYCKVYFENLVEAVTKQFNQKIKLNIVWKTDEWVAYAANRLEVMLNINNEYVAGGKDRVDKVVLAKGITIHECGHLLFTDYHLMKSAIEVFTNKQQLFPAPKCSSYEEWMTDAAIMDPGTLGEWFQVWKRLENTIEDGFIEYKLLEYLPGEGQCLYRLRQMQLEEFESIKVMRAKGLSSPAILFNCILMLAKFNTVLMDEDDAQDPAVKALLENYDLIQEAVRTDKSYNRVRLINELFCNLYHFLKEDNEENPDHGDSDSSDENTSEDSASSGSDSEESSDETSEKNDEKKEENESGESKDNPSGEDAGENNKENGNNGSSEGAENPSKSENGSDNQSDEENTDEGDSEANQGSENGNSTGSTGKNSCSPADLLNQSPDGMNEQIDTGTGSVLNDKNISQKPYQPARNQSEKLDSMMKGSENEQTAQIPSPQDRRLVDSIEEDISAREVLEEAEQNLAAELKEDAENCDFGPINNGISVSIKRQDPSNEAVSVYKRIMEAEGFLVKKTVNELRNRIKDQQQGGKINGMYNGRYLDRNNLYRYDMRIMCKNDLPEDIPNMAVCILIDGSGSMDGEKEENARKTALVIYEVCQALHIPVMVYSHNAASNVSLTALADFGSVDGQDKYRICDLKSDWGNRDGMALRFCSERLSKRPEPVKIQMIISDGLPSAYQSDAEGRADIRNVLMDFSKVGVKYMAFGLGNDQNRIMDIYTQDLSAKVAAKFVKTDAPEDLPKAFVMALKDLIKV